MGYEVGEKKQYDNAKILFTQKCRQKLIELATEKSISLDLSKNPNETGMSLGKLKYKTSEAEDKLIELDQKIEEKTADKNTLDKEHNELLNANLKLETDNKTLDTKRVKLETNNSALKVDNETLIENNTFLEEIKKHTISNEAELAFNTTLLEAKKSSLNTELEDISTELSTKKKELGEIALLTAKEQQRKDSLEHDIKRLYQKHQEYNRKLAEEEEKARQSAYIRGVGELLQSEGSEEIKRLQQGKNFMGKESHTKISPKALATAKEALVFLGQYDTMTRGIRQDTMQNAAIQKAYDNGVKAGEEKAKATQNKELEKVQEKLRDTEKALEKEKIQKIQWIEKHAKSQALLEYMEKKDPRSFSKLCEGYKTKYIKGEGLDIG